MHPASQLRWPGQLMFSNTVISRQQLRVSVRALCWPFQETRVTER